MKGFSAENFRKREIILDLWDRQVSTFAISLQVDRSEKSIKGIVHRARKAGDPRAKYRRGDFQLSRMIGRPRAYKSAPGRIPPHLRPRIINEAKKLGTDANGIIEFIVTRVFEKSGLLKIVLKEDS